MSKFSEAGSTASTLLIVFLTLALLGTIGFAYWSFTERQDYKNNSDKKSAVAVAAAEDAKTKELESHFTEEYKKPYKRYVSSSTYGSIKFEYPKTWSSYIEESETNKPLNGYFHPNHVPGVKDETTYALRLEVINGNYSDVLRRYDPQIKDGSLKAAAYIPPEMKNRDDVQPGMRLDGAIDDEKRGTVVIIKVRDKTLKVSSESPSFAKDFNKIILPSLTFSP